MAALSNSNFKLWIRSIPRSNRGIRTHRTGIKSDSTRRARSDRILLTVVSVLMFFMHDWRKYKCVWVIDNKTISFHYSSLHYSFIFRRNYTWNEEVTDIYTMRKHIMVITTTHSLILFPRMYGGSYEIKCVCLYV
jgi:hypothetical protein